MRTYLDCVPCLVRQALDAVRMAIQDPAAEERIMRRVLGELAAMELHKPPAYMGGRIHRLVREATGSPDPYKDIKDRSTALALRLLPELRSLVQRSADPFGAAARVAIAANILDFAIVRDLDEGRVRQTLIDSLDQPIAGTSIDELRAAISEAEDILYLGDNAGEIVFDRLLIEQLPREKVTVVVKGSPVINDATMADAVAGGLSGIVPLMDTGNDTPGTIPDSCSLEFRQRFDRASLVLSKGQGNYEALSGYDKDVFFLLRVKCSVIARDTGFEIGETVIQRNGTHVRGPA